jgi:hypothetical protein
MAVCPVDYLSTAGNEFSGFGSDSLTINPVTFALITTVIKECS